MRCVDFCDDDAAELSAMPAAAPPSAHTAPIADIIRTLGLFIELAPHFGVWRLLCGA
jgi:hypothetical protein